MAERITGRWIGSSSVNMEASRSSASGSDDGPAPEDPSIHLASFISEPPAPLDDRAIVDAVLAGDRDAYRQLVERESAALVRACHRVLGDLHDAEDAAQEAFVTAYRSLAGWRGDGPFGAWLTRIAIRIALRQAGRRQAVTWIDPTSPGPADRPDPAAAALAAQSVAAAPRTDPAALAVRGERAGELRDAVAALPDPYREVVTLRFFGELSLEEIARQTERPLEHREDAAPTRPPPAPRGHRARRLGMTGPARRFDPAELRTSGAPGDAQPTDADLARALGIARDLEALAADAVGPTDGFEDRVMAAIAAEPAPKLVVRPSRQRGGPIAAFVLAFRDAWGITTGGGRPMAVRAQALAFVLIVVLGVGALTTATAVTVGGLLQARPSPVPSLQPAPPSPTQQPTPIPSPTAATAEPSETPEPTETPEAGDTAAPGGGSGGRGTAAPAGTDDHGGGSNSGPGGGGGSDGGNSGPGSSDSGGGRGGGSDDGSGTDDGKSGSGPG